MDSKSLQEQLRENMSAIRAIIEQYNRQADACNAVIDQINARPRQWTAEEERMARADCMELMAGYTDKRNGKAAIVFSATMDGVTKARIAYVCGCWPQDGDHNLPLSRSGIAIGTARLAPGEPDRPWIGRMVAVRRLLRMPLPDWMERPQLERMTILSIPGNASLAFALTRPDID